MNRSRLTLSHTSARACTSCFCARPRLSGSCGSCWWRMVGRHPGTALQVSGTNWKTRCGKVKRDLFRWQKRPTNVIALQVSGTNWKTRSSSWQAKLLIATAPCGRLRSSSRRCMYALHVFMPYVYMPGSRHNYPLQKPKETYFFRGRGVRQKRPIDVR